MKCSQCGHENNIGDNYCSSCKNDLNATQSADTSAPASDDSALQSPSPEPSPEPSEAKSPSTPNQSSPSAPPSHPSAPYQQQSQAAPYTYAATPSRPAQQGYSQPVYYQTYAPRVKQPFTITDCYIIIGFVLAIIGVFAYAFILLPASIGFSIVGFVKRTNVRTLGLSIAGIVVGVVSSLIKLGTILNELGVIPDWLSTGIFG